MSDSLIAFQPAIELPSNMKPSVSWSSSTTPEHIERCCHLPLGSVKRRSTHSISSSLILETILPASLAMEMPSYDWWFALSAPRESGGAGPHHRRGAGGRPDGSGAG